MFQVFVGKIPKDVFEDELIPLIEQCGRIWDMRLMMDPMTGFNRGYCFVTYCDKDGAQECVKQVIIAPDKDLRQLGIYPPLFGLIGYFKI